MTLLPHARVLASAGTGKTHRLSSRYLDLVLRGADPRTLLATTFTRAAAAEIRQRVLVRVAKAMLHAADRRLLATDLGLDLLDSAQLERVLKELLRYLSELQICTIDSFVARLTTVGSQELGLGSTPELVYDDRERGLQARILRRIFDRLDSEEALSAFANSIEGLSKGSPAQSITDTLQEIVGFGLPPFHETRGRVAPWQWACEDGLEAIDLAPIVGELRAAAEGTFQVDRQGRREALPIPRLPGTRGGSIRRSQGNPQDQDFALHEGSGRRSHLRIRQEQSDR